MLAITKQIVSNELRVLLDNQMIWRGNVITGMIDIVNPKAYQKYSKVTWKEIDYQDTPDIISVKAKIKMKSTREGGRKTGFTSGLRPNHVFEKYPSSRPKTWIGDIQFSGQGLIQPEEESIVTVRFLFQVPIEKFIQIGRKWWIHEGSRCIANAEILEIELYKA